MRYTWDASKNARNSGDRGFDFEFATLVFEGTTVERSDTRRDYGEPRMVALGMAQGILLTVVYTDRVEGGGEVIRRIISARKSNRRERQAHKKATQPP